MIRFETAVPAIFFFNDTATTEIYTLSLHDALPISSRSAPPRAAPVAFAQRAMNERRATSGSLRVSDPGSERGSEEHTSELQSQSNLVCRLLLGTDRARAQAFP